MLFFNLTIFLYVFTLLFFISLMFKVAISSVCFQLLRWSVSFVFYIQVCFL